MPIGRRVTIIGGDLAACELADFLADRGRKVTILESGRRMATEMPIPLRWITMDRLQQSEVTMLTEVKCEEITPKGVVIATKEGERQTIEANTIVLVESVEANMELFQAIEGKVPQIYLAGDCSELRLIKGAIADGATIASSI